MQSNSNRSKPLLLRHEDNPILSRDDWPYRINSVFNPGAVRLSNGETLLLCRVEECSGRSHLCAARSHDGLNHWRIDSQPTLLPDARHYPEEYWGIEDPRVVHLPEIGKFAITYTCYSESGPGVSLALTEDFQHFERIGIILPPDNKDAALLPCRIDNRWVMIHRPTSPMGGAHIWIAYSSDLRHWGDHRRVLAARRGSWWDADKIGLSPPVIRTPKGWLMIYHSVRGTVSGAIYRLGLALLDLKDPAKCLLRSDQWIFGPETSGERTGDVGNVVFPCGLCVSDDGDTLRLYYGSADTSVGLATGSISEMLQWIGKNGSSPRDSTPV